MSDTFTQPSTALEAFDILSRHFNAEDTFNAARDLADQIATSRNVDDAVAERAEQLWIDTDDGDREAGTAKLRDFFVTIPFSAVAELGAGGESSYTDGLVTLWVKQNTDGYGRDRPNADQGFYLEVKLHVPRDARSKIESAMRRYGINPDDVYNLLDSSEYLESDTLDWVLDRDWQYELSDHYGYTALAEAEKYKRLTRAYKGIHLRNYITVAEAIEVEHFVASGQAEKFADNLAVEWHTTMLTCMIETVFDLDGPIEFGFETNGDVTLWASDYDKAKLAKVAEEYAKGKRLRKVTTVSYVME